MSNNRHGPDPVTPSVTFDSYVIPKREEPTTPPKPQAAPTQVAAAPAVQPHAQPQYLPEPPYQAYSEPEYAQEPVATAPLAVLKGIRITPMIVAATVIAVLTFMLGVVTTLQIMSFSSAPQDAYAVIPEAGQEQIQTTEGASDEAAQGFDLTPSAALEVAVGASLHSDVTRSGAADLISPVGAMSYAGDESLSMTEILQGLQPTASALPADAVLDKAVLNRNKLKMLRDHVLAGQYTVKAVERHGKERLCLRIPTGNVTQDEAADLIREAAERGEIELPEALSTADGTFDADTLIFNLVQTSLANDGTVQGAEAAREMSRRAFVASSAKTREIAGERIYIVEPGDSLAYISLQFYGQPSDYGRIFQANRQILNSPDKIQIGQRLIIPG